MTDTFHEEIRSLQEKVLTLGIFAEGMLKDSLEALEKRDPALAETIKARKKDLTHQVNQLEDEIFQMIALYQPVARDMRILVCSLTLITSSERIGRYGKDIANIARDLSPQPVLPGQMSIPHMGDLVIQMIDDSLQAFRTENLSPIEKHSQRDDIIDALRKTIFRESLTHMMEDQKYITLCVNYGMVARYLERCADHACKMAEKIHYLVTGERIEIR